MSPDPRSPLQRIHPRNLGRLGSALWVLFALTLTSLTLWGTAELIVRTRLLAFGHDAELVTARHYRVVEAEAVRQAAVRQAEEAGLTTRPEWIDVAITARPAPRRISDMAELAKELRALSLSISDVRQLFGHMTEPVRPVELRVRVRVQGALGPIEREDTFEFRGTFDGADKSHVLTSGAERAAGRATIPPLSPLLKGTLRALDVQRAVEGALAEALALPRLPAFDPRAPLPRRGNVHLPEALTGRLADSIGWLRLVALAHPKDLVAWLGKGSPRLLGAYATLLERLQAAVAGGAEAFGALPEPLQGYLQQRGPILTALRDRLEQRGVITPPF